MSQMPDSMLPRQAFDAAVQLFVSGKYVEAAPFVMRAADGGDTEAQNLLGVMYMNALGVPRDLKRAAALFEAGATGGVRECHYNLANLMFNGLGVTRDEEKAQEHLLIAARSGHPASLRSLGYLYHLMGADGQWPLLSTLCFRSAAEKGDALASFALGMRLWRGQGSAIDPAAARQAMAAAAAKNIWLAQSRLVEMQGASAAPQGGLSAQTAMRTPRGASRLEPVPFVFPGFSCPPASRERKCVAEFDAAVDPDVCDYIINVMAPYMRPSEVIHPDTGAPLRSTQRTSYSGYMIPSLYDAVVSRVWHGLSVIAGVPYAHAEPLEVLRYTPGQEYKPHYDSFTEGQRDGKRIVTTFVYLSDVLEGGGTGFPNLGLEVQPKRGKVVRFYNHLENGDPDPESRHAGLPVVKGEKWLATFWFWDRPFECYA